MARTAADERLDLSRSSGRPGRRVAVRGSNFPRRATLRIALGGRPLGRVRTDRRGRFETSFRVPRLRPGARSLIFEVAGRRVGTRFRVLPSATVSLSTSAAAIGRRVRVRGQRFPRRAPVVISLSGRRLARTRTDRRGSFSIRVRIRARRTGRHTLVVASGRTRVRRRFTVLTRGTTAPPPAPSQNPVIAAVGDLACDPASPDYNGGAGSPTNCRQRAVSDLVVGQDLARVLTLGDHQYEDDSLSKYAEVFDPTWGRVKPLIRPVLGNHEYLTNEATGYFDYFNGVGQGGGPAGERSAGYYSYDIGAWHVVALNTNCSHVGGCGPGSPQQQWLQADLASHRSACTLAYFHHPRFSSAGSGDNTAVEPLWRTLYDANADVVLSAHHHVYERFAPQNAAGGLDPTRGIRQFTVGTGGRSLHAFSAPRPNSEVRDNTTFGVLRLRLRPGGYDWEFVPEVGRTFSDGGSQTCH